MAFELVAGAVVGELLSAVLDAKDKTINFKSDFKRLESTLESVIPLVSEIERFNDELDRPRSEISKLLVQLNQGKEIVGKCSKVPWWDCYRKYRYSKRILKLDESLQKFFNNEMRVVESRDVKELLVEMKAASRKLDRLDERNGGSATGVGLEAWYGAPQLPSLTVGLDVPLKDLKMQLLKDGVWLRVLSGPGGCGKTTLASKLCRDDDVKGIFKESIFFVTVSSAPNLKAIVQTLFEQMECRVPEFQNDEGAINSLGQLLRKRDQKPLLLVLDDVWEDSESLLLNKLLESPLPACKILVTSRFTFPTFGSTYHMKLLNEQDAMTLFHHLVFPEEESDDKPDADLVKTIVRCCKGLPLALVVIARSLRRQPEVVWRTVERKWSEGPSMFDSNHYLLDRLATSLECLDEQVEECFLDMGLFSQDQKIPSSALIDMWIELYDLDEDDVFVNLLELYTRNLANLVVRTGKDVTEVDGCYNELFVVQHDLLRELAIHRSTQQNIDQRKRIFMSVRGNELSNCWKLQEKQSLSARLLSISTGNMFNSSWGDMQVPAVEVLILNFQTRNFNLPHFMEKMNNLKVLIITNSGFQPAKLNNFPQLDSLTNLRRIRLEKISIPSLDKITVQMKNLRKISLVMCEIGQALRNCSIEISNALPNLVELEMDYCNDLEELPMVLSNIICLKKLSITNCHKLCALPREIGNLADLEVLRLQACTGLSELPDSIGSLHKLSFLDISDCLSMEKLPNRMGGLCGLRKLDMRGCSRLGELPTTIMDLAQLKDVICDEEMTILWKSFQSRLTKLKVKVPKENINLNWLQI